MKKELIKKTSMDLTIPKLEALLKSSKMISEGQSVQVMRIFQSDHGPEVDISITENVTINIPDNVPEQLLKFPVIDMDLSVRNYTALKSRRIETFEEIITLGADYKKFRGIGKRNYEDLLSGIRYAQESVGYTEFDFTHLM